MITLHIPAISCGHCVRAITETVQELDPAAKVVVDIATKSASVDSGADQAAVLAALAAAGYPATPAASGA